MWNPFKFNVKQCLCEFILFRYPLPFVINSEKHIYSIVDILRIIIRHAYMQRFYIYPTAVKSLQRIFAFCEAKYHIFKRGAYKNIYMNPLHYRVFNKKKL